MSIALLLVVGLVMATTAATGSGCACSQKNVTSCTHRQLVYNLFSRTNHGHFLFDDLLNLLTYQPETVCNVHDAKMLDILDYTPQKVSNKPCNEGGFLYYGFYETQMLEFAGVTDRIRLARYTAYELKWLWRYVDKAVAKACPAALSAHKGVLHIRRKPVHGRAVPDIAVVPTGADEVYIDIAQRTTLEWLCHTVQYDAVVVPWGSELALPILLGVPVVALVNDHVDSFYCEAITSRPVAVRKLHMSSVPNTRKRYRGPSAQYYNQFAPTAGELAELTSAVTHLTAKNFSDPSIEWFPYPHPVHNDRKGMLSAVKKSRQAYLRKESFLHTTISNFNRPPMDQ